MKRNSAQSRTDRVLSVFEIEAVAGAGAALPTSIALPPILASGLQARIERLKSELREAMPRL